MTRYSTKNKGSTQSLSLLRSPLDLPVQDTTPTLTSHLCKLYTEIFKFDNKVGRYIHFQLWIQNSFPRIWSSLFFSLLSRPFSLFLCPASPPREQGQEMPFWEIEAIRMKAHCLWAVSHKSLRLVDGCPCSCSGKQPSQM